MDKREREKVDVRTSAVGWFALGLGVLVALYFVISAWQEVRAGLG